MSKETEEIISNFLLKNGFKKKRGLFYNDKCQIKIFSDVYKITFDESGNDYSMYSKNHNIYWLIGVLTYYGLMDKNYNQ